MKIAELALEQRPRERLVSDGEILEKGLNKCLDY